MHLSLSNSPFSLACVVLAAGQGSRMKSRMPKVLHPVCGIPMGLYVLQQAQRFCPHATVVVLGHQADVVEATLRAAMPQSSWQAVRQAQQRGTGHAVQQAVAHVPATATHVLVLYGDVPLLTDATVQQLVQEAKLHTLGLLTTHKSLPTGYGRVLRDPATQQVLRIVEERDCTPAQRMLTEVNAGICVLSRAVWEQALPHLQPHNAQQELYLTDVVAWAAEHGSIGTVSAPPEEVQGINDRSELAQAEHTLYQRIAKQHMQNGVTLQAPAHTYIEPTVTIDADTVIGPGVSLRGTTHVGTGCTIDTGCVLTNTRVGDNCHLKPYSVLTDSQVNHHVQVGPFAHLRPGSMLHSYTRVGNFVELKNTTMGEGSKANHLSYLGDATLGIHVNIGCGTITCNYDGVHKHHTTIEDNVFVGSDTQLVAPVRVGADAVIAAGTTVTQDVPAGALALSRVPQINKLGYTAKKRAQHEKAQTGTKKP